MDKQREEFERKFPLPIGSKYNKEHDQYDTCDEHSELCDSEYTSVYRTWQAEQAKMPPEIDALKARIAELESQFAGNVTIVKEKFYPADEAIIEQLKAERDELLARNAQMVEVLKQSGCGCECETHGFGCGYARDNALNQESTIRQPRISRRRN
jgi:hypothetical protein